MATVLETAINDVPLCPNEFGHFRDRGREFVITNLATPMPWVNVMSNGRYGLVTSQIGGGFSWIDNSQLGRLTRWDQDLVQDRQGRFVYLQDLDHPGFIWSTTAQPTLVNADFEQTVHGLGYTTYERSVNGIESSHTVFVPQDEPCEVWLVTLKNAGRQTKRLRVASYLEWHLGDSSDWHREFHRLFYQCGHEDNFLHVLKRPGLKHDTRLLDPLPPFAVHGVTGIAVQRWFCDKASFLGHPGRLDQPGYLVNGIAEPFTARWNDPIGSATGQIELAPGESKAISFVIASSKDLDEARAIVGRFSPEYAASSLQQTKDHWRAFCEESWIETGDAAFDLMNNYWLKYQTKVGRMDARCAYYQQGGAYGYRDQLQDSLGMLPIDASLTKRQLVLHAEAMYEDGVVRHWWHPNSNIFVESQHSDTCLWLGYGVLAYLDETNDLPFLEESCRYLNHNTQQFGGEGTVLEHVLRGIDRCLSKRSPRGLPLILSGDWNDGLSHAGVEGKAESVWLGMFLFDILNRLVPVLSELGLSDEASKYANSRDEVQRAVNTFGWDGEWYIQGTRDDGKLLGSATSSAGNIFLNPQTWSVISGIAPTERTQQGLAAARERLVKSYGALLLAPAFSELDPYVGYITRYAPGCRENGGVYSHAATWMIQAMAMAGWIDEARKLYANMIPCNGRSAEQYAAEPYVMPGNVDGPDSPYEARAGWTWYTGSAAWMSRIAFEWICGVRATRLGLLVAPQAGRTPFNFLMRRKFRGDIFNIEVGGSGSNCAVTCETAAIVDGLLQSSGTGAEHLVKVQFH